MSDVWQGPGWWLASDGKWYPADAEPGAVYEGELQNNSPADEVIDPPAPPPVAPKPDPVVVEPLPEVPSAPEPVAAQPVIPTEPEPTPAATFGADPFAQMPAPVVEEPAQMPAPVVEEPKVGGWQSVDPAPPSPVEAVAAPETIPAPQPTAPEPHAPVVEEDGWTSAYEERQDTPDVNAPASSAPPAPEVQIPDVPAAPVQQIPEVQIPEVQIPDVPAAPVQQIPEVQIPEVQIPEVSAPELTTNPVPVIEVPSVDVPDVDIPTPVAPVVPLPDTNIPEIQPPGMAVPTNPPVEISEVGSPLAGSPAASQPIIGDDATIVRDATMPIERDDAWRKPSMGDDTAGRPAPATPTANPGVPDVVDLAIPDEAPVYIPEPQGRRWGVVAAAIAGLLLIAALAWFITTLFNGDDGVDTGGEPSDTTAVTEPDTSDASTSTDASAPTTTGDGGEENPDVSVFALRAGDCIVGDIGAGQVTKVTKVDCEEEHQFEVYREALIESSITSFDEEAISAYAEEVCRTSLEAYIPPDDDRGLKFKFLQPTEDSWNQAEDPDRVITCLLFDDDAPLVGRAGP